MQTLKTAAILVLMTVVMIGAYNTMTGTPDPLPPEIGMLVESGGFEISDGMPESFNDFAIDDGLPGSSDPDGSAAMTLSDLPPASPTARSATTPSMSLDPVNRNFADIPPASSKPKDAAPNASAPSDFSMTDLPGAATTAGMNRLPPVTSKNSVKPDPSASYPSTGNAFELPDPNQAVELATQSLGPVKKPADAPATAANSVAQAGLANAIATADRQYSADRRREALATLSLFYETPNLTAEQRQQLLDRLDPLAREVVYSREHLLDKPHRVGPSETLMEIAKKYEVPWQLLANINAINDPVTVLPGTDLKVVRGPFRADVDLKNQELTLFVGDLYAGRFPIGVGTDPAPKPGSYMVQEKQSAKTYYDLSGSPVPPGSPKNPYGAMWIDLGSGLSIHGSPLPDQPTREGCISVAGNYSRDVFGILSEGSSVTIR